MSGLMLMTGVAFAQTMKVSGTVLDASGNGLPGATVVVSGTNAVATTDLDGRFVLEQVNASASLTISYIGYVSQEVVVNGRAVLEVTLQEDSVQLDEMVVVGFGSQKKVNLTGAVAAVKMDDVLGDRPVTSLGAILQGAMPGLTTSTSVVPGGGNSFNIRGTGSINGGGGSPLILVDNVVYNDLYLLNPADIESVSVLKDASSAAIYGARASFGVILFTTKKAKKNERLTINYNNNFGISRVDNLPQISQPDEYIQALKDGGYTSLWSGQNIDTYQSLISAYNANPSQYPNGWTYDENGTKYFMKSTDWFDEMFTPSWKQTHNLSAQGGSERIQYRLSLGYTDEDGIMISRKDSFKRTNVSTYVKGDITKWLSTSLDVQYNNGDKLYPYLGSGSELGIFKYNVTPFYPTGNLPYGVDGPEYPVMTGANIINLANASKTVTDNTRIMSRTVLTPLEGLEAVLEYSYQLGLTDYEAYQNLYEVHQGMAESIKPSSVTTPFTTYRATTKYTTINAYVNYNKTFGTKHNVSAIVGYNQEYNDYRYLESTAYNMISNELPSLSGTDGSTPPDTYDAYNQYALRSGFLRATYNYAQRYFIEIDGRYDLSSKFPKDYRGGFFPSVSAAWNVANEPFMESLKQSINTLKIRGSYGTLGNQNVDNYGYLATMNVGDAGWLYNGLIPKTLGAPGMVRATYTWEKVATINGGIDLGFLNNRLTGSFDMYKRLTTGMLGPSEELPSVAGASAPTQNAADMETYGWEVSLGWKDSKGAFSYGISANLYDARSYITKYKNETKSLSASYYEGQELGEIWGYVTDGFYTANDFEANGKLKEGVVSINGVTSHEGDIKFKNLRDDDNSTNRIDTGDNTADNPGDRQVIGNSRARLQYGVSGYLDWKGLQFSFILQGVGKRDSWLGGAMTFPMPDMYNTIFSHQVGKIWTPDNIDNAFYGRIYENAGSSQGSNQRTSDKFLWNSAYMRVKNITLSYTLPKNWVNKIYLQNVKVFVSAENPFTFDKLPSGIDPESLGWTYPHYKTVSFGINITL